MPSVSVHRSSDRREFPMYRTLCRIGLHALLFLITSTGLAANGDNWGDVRTGHARMPGYFAPLIRATFPACLKEDSTWCYWDGRTRGDHFGDSFVTLAEGTHVTYATGGQPIPAAMIPTLRQEPGQSHRDWSLCRWYVGDTSWIICPDGYRISS